MSNETMRSAVLGAKKKAPVPFEFNGQTLWVRHPTVADVEAIKDRSKLNNDLRSQALTLIDLIVDEAGTPVFDKKDVDSLMLIDLVDWQILSKPVEELLTKAAGAAAKN